MSLMDGGNAGGSATSPDPFAVAGVISKAIGNLFSGVMSYNAGRAQAGQLHQAALQSAMESGVQAGEALQGGEQAAARAAVMGAANGGGLTGSTLGIVSNLGQQAMFNARVAAYRGQTTAALDDHNAKVAKVNATNALIDGVVGSVAQGASGWFKTSYKMQSMDSLSRLRGLGGDTAYDYNP